MMLIPYVADVKLTLIDGTPIQDPDGVQATITQRAFLLGRIADATFSEGKRGMEAVFFAIEAKKDIDDQSDVQVRAQGGWHVEDERGAALKRATEQPTGDGSGRQVGFHPTTRHCLGDLCQAMRDMKKIDVTVAKKTAGKSDKKPAG